MSTLVYEYQGSAKYELHRDGKFTVNGVECEWYFNERTGEPWIPAKRKSFVSLVKMAERDEGFQPAKEVAK